MADDDVVREYDVYLLSSIIKEGCQADFVHYPLRPPWRPYDFSETKTVRHKPKAGRLEMETGLDTQSDNYDQDAPEDARTDKLRLQARASQLPGSFAAATIRDNHITLVPVSTVWQMQPDMTYRDTAAEKAAAWEKDKAEQPDKGLQQLHGTTRRVENARQRSLRQASYAHQQQEEDREPWLSLDYLGPESKEAKKMVELMGQPVATDGPSVKAIRPLDYLNELLPLEEQPLGAMQLGPLPPAASPAAAKGLGSQAKGKGKAEAAAEEAPSAVQAGLHKALQQLLSQHPVVGMETLRKAAAAEPGLADWVSSASNEAVEACASAASGIYCIESSFVACTEEPYERLAVELLQAAKGKPVKRQTAVKAAEARGLDLTDSTYSKVVLKTWKELCEGKGGGWVLREPA